jgi:hypothetical protein
MAYSGYSFDDFGDFYAELEVQSQRTPVAVQDLFEEFIPASHAAALAVVDERALKQELETENITQSDVNKLVARVSEQVQKVSLKTWIPSGPEEQGGGPNEGEDDDDDTPDVPKSQEQVDKEQTKKAYAAAGLHTPDTGGSLYNIQQAELVANWGLSVPNLGRWGLKPLIGYLLGLVGEELGLFDVLKSSGLDQVLFDKEKVTMWLQKRVGRELIGRMSAADYIFLKHSALPHIKRRMIGEIDVELAHWKAWTKWFKDAMEDILLGPVSI